MERRACFVVVSHQPAEGWCTVGVVQGAICMLMSIHAVRFDLLMLLLDLLSHSTNQLNWSVWWVQFELCLVCAVTRLVAGCGA